jgi:dihydrofolate reductase
MYQRSADMFLGVPFNIASYALLQSILANILNLIPGEFVHTFGDAHIYNNSIEQVKEQLNRKPKKLPKLIMPNLDSIEALNEYSVDDFVLEGYESHPALKAQWLYRLMIISHLVALSNNFVIGVNNDLPWKLKKDLQHFSAYTQNKAIVMGRKTFESIGRPLPNRKNIVISSTLNAQEGIDIVSSLDQGIEVADHWNKLNTESEEVVLIGGGYVFEESKNIVNKLVLTRVNCEIDGDVYYPKIDLSSWEKSFNRIFQAR